MEIQISAHPTEESYQGKVVSLLNEILGKLIYHSLN